MTGGEKHQWKVLESKYLVKRKWLTARCDRVQLSNGVVNDEYYVLEYPEWVNTIAITREGEFIVIRQYRHGIRETGYEICAGICEEGEQPELAARRELLEETGYAGGEWSKLLEIAPNASSMNNYTHCFLAVGVEKIDDSHLDPTEELDVFLLQKEEVFDLLQSGMIKQATMVAPLWKYFYEQSCGK